MDFAWVSSRFLETLDPDEEQILSAVERFNPAALEDPARDGGVSALELPCARR